MIRYSNNTGSSGIHSYEVLEDGLKVLFTSGSVYIYDRYKLGENRYQIAIKKAMYGSGLNSFLLRECRGTYSKIR